MTKTFGDLGVEPALCDALTATGITHPFPIQELTLPLALAGNDLIGQARTGTGKTLAFGLPLLQRLDPTKRVTQALVVVPTRELCLQVSDDLQIGAKTGITLISVYGGVGYDEQIEALRSGVHVVVGTPGRLLDHLNRGNLDLSHVTQLVLDEADEMLDMGFLPDVERLIEACSGDRHTMLFSATMPTAIVKLARRYLDHPTFTRADTEPHETAPTVEQHFLQVHRMDKPRVLARILQSPKRGGVYVFVRTKHMADRLVNELEQLGVPAIPIHGDLRQSSREKNMDRFRAGKATVLVATEVAARGLDVTGVTHVVNYDCPEDEKMYLHRIGRTARAGEAGVAVTFAEFNEVDRLNVIRKAVGATNAQVEQVFSTSDVLTELFDLPKETPWEQPTRRNAQDTRSSRSQRAALQGAGDLDRADDGGRGAQRRKGRSDGRPKSGRRAEGSGGDHDASRPQADPAGGERVRTRTRQRTDAAGSTPTARRGRASTGRSSDERTATPRGSKPTRRADAGSDPGASTDAGARPRPGEDPGSETHAEHEAAATPSSARQRARSGRRRDGGGQQTRQQGSSAGTHDVEDAQAGGATNRSRNRSSSTGHGSRMAARDTATRDTGARGSGARGTGGRGSGRDPDDTDAIKLERRGRDARGGGQPQLARRVKVEHLP